MKIDYELAKKIGATHHIDRLLYKFDDEGSAMCYFGSSGWEKTENNSRQMSKLERINFEDKNLR